MAKNGSLEGARVAVLVALILLNMVCLSLCIWYSSIVYLFDQEEPKLLNTASDPRIATSNPSIRENVSAAVSLTHGGVRVVVVVWNLLNVCFRQRTLPPPPKELFLLASAAVALVDVVTSSFLLGLLGKDALLLATLRLNGDSVPEKPFVQASLLLLTYLSVLLHVLSLGLACSSWPPENPPVAVDGVQIEMGEISQPRGKSSTDASTMTATAPPVAPPPPKAEEMSKVECRYYSRRSPLGSVGIEVTDAELDTAKKSLRKVSCQSFESNAGLGVSFAHPVVLTTVAEVERGSSGDEKEAECGDRVFDDAFSSLGSNIKHTLDMLRAPSFSHGEESIKTPTYPPPPFPECTPLPLLEGAGPSSSGRDWEKTPSTNQDVDGGTLSNQDSGRNSSTNQDSGRNSSTNRCSGQNAPTNQNEGCAFSFDLDVEESEAHETGNQNVGEALSSDRNLSSKDQSSSSDQDEGQLLSSSQDFGGSSSTVATARCVSSSRRDEDGHSSRSDEIQPNKRD